MSEEESDEEEPGEGPEDEPPSEEAGEEEEEGEIDPLSHEVSPASGLHRKYPPGPTKPTP
jgi:hypothetical protein